MSRQSVDVFCYVMDQFCNIFKHLLLLFIIMIISSLLYLLLLNVSISTQTVSDCWEVFNLNLNKLLLGMRDIHTTYIQHTYNWNKIHLKHKLVKVTVLIELTCVKVTSLWILFDRQSLSMAETEKNQLLEKLNNTQREMANASMEMDRVKRETFSKAEQDKVRYTELVRCIVS